jgi:hypothetical protein
LPPHKLKFFKEYVSKKYKEMKNNTLTTRDICDYYTEKTGKRMSSNNLRHRYIPEFLDNGLLEEQPSPTDKRTKIYYPLADFDEECGTNTVLEGQYHIFTHEVALNTPKGAVLPRKTWLIDAIDKLKKCGTSGTEFSILSHAGIKVSEERFVCIYEFFDNLVSYFKNRHLASFHSEIFADVKYFGEIPNGSKENCGTVSPVPHNTTVPYSYDKPEDIPPES